MRTKTTIIINDSDCRCHHMPDNANYPELRDGMTLRAALAELRRAEWGNIGGTYDIELSDGTWIAVDLRACNGGGWLMNSQYVRRYGARQGQTYTVRCYTL